MAEPLTPQLVELPFASTCEHEEIIYWHTVDGTKAEGVRLHKSTEVIHFDMWVPAKAYKITMPLSGTKPKKISERDMQLAVLKAYEAMPERVRDAKTEHVATVIIQGHPGGIKVQMSKVVVTKEEPCWRDSSGRVW